MYGVGGQVASGGGRGGVGEEGIAMELIEWSEWGGGRGYFWASPGELGFEQVGDIIGFTLHSRKSKLKLVLYPVLKNYMIISDDNSTSHICFG